MIMDLHLFISLQESRKPAPDNRYMFEGKEFVKIGKSAEFGCISLC